jgi:hypothetical protein
MPKTAEFRPDIPAELRERLDALLAEYKALRRKEAILRRRYEARIMPFRAAIAEVYDHMEDRLGRLEARRNALSEEFLAVWAERFPDLPRVDVNSWRVYRRKDVRVEVRDKREVIKALDRLDRLDLVEHEIDEKGLRKLVRDGKLGSLPEGALKVKEKVQIQVMRRKEG